MKTAGTSFRTMLEREFDDRIYPTQDELRQLPNRWYLRTPDLLSGLKNGSLDLKDRKVLCGHYPARLPEHLEGNWKTVLFLRDPINRTLSILSHHKRNLGFFAKRGPLNISKLLKKNDFVEGQITNYQTKVLALPGDGNVNQPYSVDEAAFEKAVEVLESTDCVGLTEDFKTSMQNFSRISGIQFSDGMVRTNQNRKKRKERPPTDLELEAIRELIPYDIKLFEIAKKRLQMQSSA